MKSAVFYGKHDLRIEELQKPSPKDREVLIKVMACGVCGTDVHIYEGDKGAADSPSGTVLGHEFSGIVEAVGASVTNYKLGDRVCIDPNALCGECYYCRNGIGHFCEKMIGIGTTCNGGFSEYCVVPQSQVYKIGDTTTFEEAAMTEPVACCLHGIDMCNIKPGSTALVIGGGMIGLIMLQLAKLNGASTVVLMEPVEEKREMGRKLGADLCINPSDDIHSLLKENKINRFDVVIECVGLTKTIAQAIELAGKKSTVMMFGLTKPDDTVSIKPFEIFQKEIDIKASFINPYTQTRAINLIDTKKIDVTSMVHRVASLNELKDILSKPELRAKGKYIINPWM
ncbi:alcohol dehydrogenase catalytic domain-containing protein [Anaerocolumna sedimenticola]|uniref:Alcohol dehydrogenase catalytic domain-containing protein n=1 Tax=Anaerocolumna sedimenticola TaxID=2696063 RepID=A0A6P1TKS8_9FIRM|nr:zinc-dependent alcohol dehydrogenase family protein [Anaerocolumna sedimenticola]QHQ60897.1 alcohol dehydrogenase catalytic domain-containing protein [Anaerocolumna sedimenticola]